MRHFFNNHFCYRFELLNLCLGGPRAVLRNSNEVVASFLDSINALCGGKSASLYIPPSLGSRAEASIVSLGSNLLTANEFKQLHPRVIAALDSDGNVEDYALTISKKSGPH